MIRPRFSPADVERAHLEWGANCGPGAAAAILGLTLDEVRPLFAAQDFESKHYTNPTMMLDVLRATGCQFKQFTGTALPADPWPTWGLVRIQWEGPWMLPSVPMRARYRYTHWVGAGRHGDNVAIFDVNAVGSGPAKDHTGWTTLQGWRDNVWPLLNVWIGVSVENQEAADERIPELLRTPAAVRFLSCEPLLGEVDLDPPLCDRFDRHGSASYTLADDEATPWCSECESERSYGHWLHLDGGIDWVIAGCESGPGACPCEVEWLRSLRDQCAAAGTAFFLKQARADELGYAGSETLPVTTGPGSKRKSGGVIGSPLLDDVQHLAFPEVSR